MRNTLPPYFPFFSVPEPEPEKPQKIDWEAHLQSIKSILEQAEIGTPNNIDSIHQYLSSAEEALSSVFARDTEKNINNLKIALTILAETKSLTQERFDRLRVNSIYSSSREEGIWEAIAKMRENNIKVGFTMIDCLSSSRNPMEITKALITAGKEQLSKKLSEKNINASVYNQIFSKNNHNPESFVRSILILDSANLLTQANVELIFRISNLSSGIMNCISHHLQQYHQEKMLTQDIINYALFPRELDICTGNWETFPSQRYLFREQWSSMVINLHSANILTQENCQFLAKICTIFLDRIRDYVEKIAKILRTATELSKTQEAFENIKSLFLTAATKDIFTNEFNQLCSMVQLDKLNAIRRISKDVIEKGLEDINAKYPEPPSTPLSEQWRMIKFR